MASQQLFFFGWWIVGVAFLAHCITTGIVFYSFGIFLKTLSDHFGWSLAATSFGFSLATLCGAIYAPAVGRLVDRRGPRPAQLLGAGSMAVGFLLLRNADSLWTYYLCLGTAVALGSTALGALPSNAAVAAWFVRRRGRALGISTAGISMGGVIFVPLTEWLIRHYGWRDAFGWLAVIIVVVIVPPVTLLMRRSPEAMGLRPDGEPARAGPASTAIDLDAELERSWTPAQAVRHRNFYLVAAAFALTMTGITACLLHQVAFLGDRGLSAAEAKWVLAAVAGAGVIGKLGFGALLDRYPQEPVIMGCFGLQAVGLLLLLLPTTWPGLALYVVVYGFAMGGNATLQATVIAGCFGRLHYGSIAGRLMPFVVTLQSVGIPAAGWVRDELGSYEPAFVGLLLATLLAMACVHALERDARPPGGAG